MSLGEEISSQFGNMPQYQTNLLVMFFLEADHPSVFPSER